MWAMMPRLRILLKSGSAMTYSFPKQGHTAEDNAKEPQRNFTGDHGKNAGDSRKSSRGITTGVGKHAVEIPGRALPNGAGLNAGGRRANVLCRAIACGERRVASLLCRSPHAAAKCASGSLLGCGLSVPSTAGTERLPR